MFAACSYPPFIAQQKFLVVFPLQGPAHRVRDPSRLFQWPVGCAGQRFHSIVAQSALTYVSSDSPAARAKSRSFSSSIVCRTYLIPRYAMYDSVGAAPFGLVALTRYRVAARPAM